MKALLSGPTSKFFEELINQVVILDLRSPFVCLGKLVRVSEQYVELRNADFHDLRDTQTSRENYVVSSRVTGIKRNRKRVFIPTSEIVGISGIDDVVEK